MGPLHCDHALPNRGWVNISSSPMTVPQPHSVHIETFLMVFKQLLKGLAMCIFIQRLVGLYCGQFEFNDHNIL